MPDKLLTKTCQTFCSSHTKSLSLRPGLGSLSMSQHSYPWSCGNRSLGIRPHPAKGQTPEKEQVRGQTGENCLEANDGVDQSGFLIAPVCDMDWLGTLRAHAHPLPLPHCSAVATVWFSPSVTAFFLWFTFCPLFQIILPCFGVYSPRWMFTQVSVSLSGVSFWLLWI